MSALLSLRKMRSEYYLSRDEIPDTGLSHRSPMIDRAFAICSEPVGLCNHQSENNEVPMGRRMKGAEIFMAQSATTGSSIGFPIRRWENLFPRRSNARYTTGVV